MVKTNMSFSAHIWVYAYAHTIETVEYKFGKRHLHTCIAVGESDQQPISSSFLFIDLNIGVRY